MSDATLRVLTLNCWNVSEPFDRRMALIRAEVERVRPDLIGMQEVVVRRDGFDQGAVMLEGLGYERVFGPAFRWNDAGALLPPDADGDAFGNLIASRWPVVGRTVHVLPCLDDGEHRSACAALVSTPAGILPFVTTHFNWRPEDGSSREQQALSVAAFVAEWARAAALPPILVGDLNAESDSREIRFLCGGLALEGRRASFRDAWRVAGDGQPGLTWDNRNRFAAYAGEPDRRIDYILVGPGRGTIDAVRLAMNRARDGVFPSDHFGVVADVRL
jgi:endonuclease/exonuclease/phosphatase family metal-dependent hydrolase